MTHHELTFVFRLGSLGVKPAAQAVLEAARHANQPLTGYLHRGEEISLSDLERRVMSRGGKGFLVEGHGLEIDRGTVGDNELDFLVIENHSPKKDWWRHWEEAVVRRDGFVMGWLADHDYQYWQNCEDLERYRAAGRPLEKLSLRSNGLPYPLEAIEVDTSKNPGRRVIRNGYIEAVGAIMWASTLLSKRTGVPLEQLAHSELAKTVEIGEGVLRLECSKRLFTSDSEASRQLQDAIRELVFPPRSKRRKGPSTRVQDR